MLAIRIEITYIDYEKCVRSLLERFQAKIQERPDTGLFGRLLGKLGRSAPDVFCCLLGYLPDEGKVMLISELANEYREKLTDASNEALASNELGKNVSFGTVEFGAAGQQLSICARDVKINYAGILDNENVRKKVEDAAKQYVDHSALGKKLPGMGSLLKGGAGSVAKFAAILAPGEIEKKALQILAAPERKEKLIRLLEDALAREGLAMQIGEISLLHMHAGSDTGQKDDMGKPALPIRPGEAGDKGQTEGLLSGETEEMLLDALSEYLKDSVYGRRGE